MYKDFVTALIQHADANDWCLEPDSSRQEFYFHFSCVDRMFNGSFPFPGIRTVFSAYETSPFDDQGEISYIDLIDVGDMILEVHVNFPEYRDDESDGELHISRIEGSASKHEIIQQYKIRFAERSLDFARCGTTGMSAEWIAAIDRRLGEMVGPFNQQNDPETIVHALARLSSSAMELSDTLQLDLIKSRCPDTLISMSWSMDYVYGDDGSYYLDIEPVILHFCIDNRNINLSVRCDEFELADLEDDELTALTGFPVIDDESRDMVLDYYSEDESRLFDLDPVNFTDVAHSLARREHRDSHEFRAETANDTHSEAA